MRAYMVKLHFGQMPSLDKEAIVVADDIPEALKALGLDDTVEATSITLLPNDVVIANKRRR